MLNVTLVPALNNTSWGPQLHQFPNCKTQTYTIVSKEISLSTLGHWKVQICIENILFINSKATLIEVEPHWDIKIYLTTIELTISAMFLWVCMVPHAPRSPPPDPVKVVNNTASTLCWPLPYAATSPPPDPQPHPAMTSQLAPSPKLHGQMLSQTAAALPVSPVKV
jgi:hypothetical protein